MKLSISTTRRETVLGWSYLLVSMFVLPIILGLGNGLLPSPLSETVLNLIYFSVNFLCVVIIFRRFLRRSVNAALEKPWNCLRFALAGFLIYYLATNFIALVIYRIDPHFVNINDVSIAILSGTHYYLMAFATILLVPVTEEVLYRGLLFQSLQQKNRMLAYLVSTCVFAGIHIIGYVGTADFRTLSLCFIQYLPAGITLAWAYEKTDTVIAPILMHITINQIGIAALR